MTEQNQEIENTAYVTFNNDKAHKNYLKFELFFDGFKDGKVPLHKLDDLDWMQRTIRNSAKCRRLNITKFVVLDDEGNEMQSMDTSEPAAGTNKLPGMKFSDPVVQSKFSIDERFEFISDLIRMVQDGVSKSMIITGEGGIGKSYTVLENLEGKIEGVHYELIKGFSTAKGLFQTLFRNKNSLIIFDDCDSVLKDPIASNLLKGALDGISKKRTITWASDDRMGGDMPKKFDFNGQVIFISNIPSKNLSQALLSRSMFVDLEMSVEDKIKRMWTILPKILPEVNIEKREESMQFIEDHKDAIKDLNFRTLDKVIKIRIGVTNWERMAEYMTCGG